MTTKNELYAQSLIETGSSFTMDASLDRFNARLRVDDYRGSVRLMHTRILALANEHALTKIFIKSRPEDVATLLGLGYMLEGVFKKYFNGGDAYSMAMYLSDERRTSEYWIQEDDILRQVLSLPLKASDEPLAQGYTIRIAVTEDAEQLAHLYGTVFQTYPTPMNDPAYIKKVMLEGTVFYVAEAEARIVSAASAEINAIYNNAEMTDCATYNEHRKHGLMRHLITALENELQTRHIYCAYSLARSLSFGMNAVFHQLGYEYAGRMTKNCNIFDKLEDMSLWVKDLSRC
ncbi:putative beta-lysine N-acetyltransferase [Aneurinibacillus sp. REN35]|uniref:putative beta-lysine N-acetyltransferase n=1 Tax=Aneurinibacillus sp. REN35 TaxID=3237286 RepID=UPI003529CD23